VEEMSYNDQVGLAFTVGQPSRPNTAFQHFPMST